jgi:hypothetical protein
MLFLLSRARPQGTPETLRQIWEVLSRYEHELVNFGTPNPNRQGGALHEMEKLRTATSDSRLIMAVFKDRDTMTACLKEIQERDFGMSLVISGLYEETRRACRQVGLSPHTVNLSLGIHGKTQRLPDEQVLEIHTLCGHGMISFRLIAHMAEQIKKGRMTCNAAAQELSRMCDCGIFNTVRAEKILQAMTS